MPPSYSEQFFPPETQRRRLETREYQESENVTKMRQLDNLSLVEFKELTLTSHEMGN